MAVSGTAGVPLDPVASILWIAAPPEMLKSRAASVMVRSVPTKFCPLYTVIWPSASAALAASRQVARAGRADSVLSTRPALPLSFEGLPAPEQALQLGLVLRVP